MLLSADAVARYIQLCTRNATVDALIIKFQSKTSPVLYMLIAPDTCDDSSWMRSLPKSLRYVVW